MAGGAIAGATGGKRAPRAAEKAGIAAQAIMQSIEPWCGGAGVEGATGSQWPAIAVAGASWVGAGACAWARPNGAISSATRMKSGMSLRTAAE